MPHLGTQMHARPSIMRVDARAPLTHTHTVHVLASFRHPRNMAKFGSEHVCGSQSGKSKVQRAYVGASLDVIKAKKSKTKLLNENNLLLVRPSCANMHTFVA